MWKFVMAGREADCVLEGKRIFDHAWVATGEKVVLPDPIYNEKHTLTVYEVTFGERVIIFAAGEFSNSVWGIFVRE